MFAARIRRSLKQVLGVTAAPSDRRPDLRRASLAIAAWTMVLLLAPPSRAGDPDPTKAAFSSQGHASLLGIEGKGTKFVYVFDHSGSMGVPGNRPLDRAKKELLASIDGLNELQQFYIIFYNQDQKMFRIDSSGGRAIWANDHNKKLARQFVDSIAAEGGTRHAEAISLALRLHPDVIFQLTDGDPADDLAKDELERLGKLADGTIINVIQISSPEDNKDSRLMALAQHSGGKHIFVDFTKAEDKAGEKEH